MANVIFVNEISNYARAHVTAFWEADLTLTNFSYATLENAMFENTELGRTNLECTILTGANFKGATHDGKVMGFFEPNQAFFYKTVRPDGTLFIGPYPD